MAQLNGKEILLAGLKGDTGQDGAPLFVSSASEDQNGTRLIVETAFQSITPKAGNYVLYSGEAKASLATGNVYKVESLDIGGEGEIVCVVDPASPLGNIRGPEGESGNDGADGAGFWSGDITGSHAADDDHQSSVKLIEVYSGGREIHQGDMVVIRESGDCYVLDHFDHDENYPVWCATTGDPVFSLKGPSGVPDDVYTKSETDGLLAGKLERPANPTKDACVYIGPNGYVGTITYDTTAYAGTLARRTADGRLRAADPADNTDLVNKQYAEANFEAKKAKRKVSVKTLTNGNAWVILERKGDWTEIAVFGSRPSADCLNHYSGSRIKPSRVKTVKALKKAYIGTIGNLTHLSGCLSAQEIVAFLLGVPKDSVGSIDPAFAGKVSTGCGEFHVSQGIASIIASSPVFRERRTGWRNGTWIATDDRGPAPYVCMQGGIFHFAIDNVGRDEIDANDGRVIQLYRNTIIASLKISLWGSYQSEDQSNWIVRSEVLM